MARRPSILGSAVRTAGRTAIIAGTATAVSNKVAAKQANAGASTAQPTSVEPPAEAPSTAGISEEALGRLSKLAELHKAGILTDEEFATQKARILG